MFKIKLLFVALLISIVLSGCGVAIPILQPLPSPRPLPTSQSIPELTGAWTASMQLSGGIAGVSRSIEIASNGMAVAKDDRNGKTMTRQLTSDELTQFVSLINSASLKSMGSTPASCVDCFIYNIKTTSNGGSFSAQFDDVNLPDSGMGSVVKYLMDLLNQMLASG